MVARYRHKQSLVSLSLIPDLKVLGIHSVKSKVVAGCL